MEENEKTSGEGIEVKLISDLKNLNEMDKIKFNYFYMKGDSSIDSKTCNGVFGGMFNSKGSYYFAVISQQPSGEEIFDTNLYKVENEKIEYAGIGFVGSIMLQRMNKKEISNKISEQLNFFKVNTN